MVSIYSACALRSFSYGMPAALGSGRIISVYATPGESTPPKIQLVGDGDLPLTIPYGFVPATTELGKPQRSSLDLSVAHAPLLQFCAQVDEEIKRIALLKCTAWFKKQLTEAEIQTLHKPLVVRDLLRVKALMTGPKAVRVWKIQNSETGWIYSLGSTADVHAGSRCWVTVEISSLFFLSRLFGCSLMARDILILPEEEPLSPPSFPFITEHAMAAPVDLFL
jgi:hypothetical protein